MNTKAIKKKKKGKIRKMQKGKSRNHDFHCTTKHLGIGVNGIFNILHEKDGNRKIIKTHQKENQLKKKLSITIRRILRF